MRCYGNVHSYISWHNFTPATSRHRRLWRSQGEGGEGGLGARPLLLPRTPEPLARPLQGRPGVGAGVHDVGEVLQVGHEQLVGLYQIVLPGQPAHGN